MRRLLLLFSFNSFLHSLIDSEDQKSHRQDIAPYKIIEKGMKTVIFYRLSQTYLDSHRRLSLSRLDLILYFVRSAGLQSLSLRVDSRIYSSSLGCVQPRFVLESAACITHLILCEAAITNFGSLNFFFDYLYFYNLWFTAVLSHYFHVSFDEDWSLFHRLGSNSCKYTNLTS